MWALEEDLMILHKVPYVVKYIDIRILGVVITSRIPGENRPMELEWHTSPP